jgi:glycosyltransferase involved in cell wall biosynthesis
MSDAPLVSVVIPSRDSAAWAEGAVASVLAQPEVPAEVVLVDDGSGADAAQRLEVLALPPSVRLVRQPATGADRARRRGWEEARGRFVAFLDDDDRQLPGYLATCAGILAAQPEAGAVYTRFREVDPGGALRRVRPRRGYAGRRFADEVRKGSVKTSTLMVRREALLDLADLCEAQRSGGNYDLILRLRYCHAFAFVGTPLVAVTNRPGSLSKQRSGPYEAKAEILENLLEVFPDMAAAERRAVGRKAARYWLAAGDLARAQGRGGDALRCYRRSLACRVTLRGLQRQLAGAGARQLPAR